MKSSRIRSAKPQTTVFRGMIGHSMVNSKILLLKKPRVWWELEGPQVPLRPDCLAIVNNFVFLLGGEELGPDGEFHASSKVFRYDPRLIRASRGPFRLKHKTQGPSHIHIPKGKTPLEVLVEISLTSSFEDRESALISRRYGVPGFFILLLY